MLCSDFFRRKSGFTLIEILMVVVLVTLLITISIPSFTWLRDRASFAGCVSRLRIMHVGFNNYMQDHDMIWPQMSSGPTTKFPTESDEWKWWFEQLEDHGVSRNHWICPSDRELTAKGHTEDYFSSYIPTAFDNFPNTAFRWKQPWVIERTGFHYKDKGPNMLMPDGVIAQGVAIPAP